MRLDLTAREAKMLLIVTTRLLEFDRNDVSTRTPVDPEIQSVTRKLELVILEQNQVTTQYRQTAFFPLQGIPEA